MVIAAKAGKLVAAMPANSCMPVSDEPPLFAVSIKETAKTARVVNESRKFSVNWIGFSERRIINLLAQSNDSPDKLASLQIPYFQVFDTPVLSRAIGYAVCETISTQSAGDHELIIAKVLGAMATLDFDQNWKFEEYQPVLYLGSTFRNPYGRMVRK
jgi:flavin reductase (DIM6/NTAB) family NADH-FMN oxidoreductase RutF